MSVTVEKIEMGHGKTTQLVKVTTDALTVELVSYGAHLYRVLAKDRDGLAENVVLNVTPISELANDLQYFGATIGPIAGRIKAARIGDLTLEANENGNSLHSGSQGWSFQEWDMSWEENGATTRVIFSYLDEKSGFPGPISVKVVYEVRGNELTISFLGETTTPTYFNPTNHAYFNLSGDMKQTIGQQTLEISAPHILATDAGLIPTGELIAVAGTPYDFTKEKTLDLALHDLPEGLDTVYAFQKHASDHHVTLSDKASGRFVTVTSDAGSVIVYSASGWDRETEVNGRPMVKELGLAIEFQELPDSPNHPEWDSVALLPGEEVVKRIHYRFGVSKNG